MQGSQQAFARELAHASTGIRYQNAENMRDDWYNRLNRRQQLDDANYGQYLDQRDFRGSRIGLLSNALGSIKGGTSSSTGPNPNYRSAGQNAAGYAALLASMWGS